MKNPNGYGSVYKLTGKRRRPWVARVTKEYTDEGEQIREIIGYYKEQADAILALANYHNEPITPKADITLKELYEEWSAIKYESISKSRTNGYKQGWNYLCKYENVKFKELRTSQLQSCLKDKKRDTANNIKIVANMLYKYAMENDIINKNYAAFLQLPRKSKEEKSIFTDIEIQKIEKNAGKIEWLDTVLILIYTGLRITEFLTLTKFNIDLKAKTITGGIKSDAGKNRVPPKTNGCFNNRCLLARRRNQNLV
jgi:integrase